MNLVGGTLVAARFRLVRVLGQGGMGAVWFAQDTKLDTPCAVKFILGDAAESPELRARFEREAKSAAQLRSPNVVNILDHGISEGVPYIAMELLEGEDLANRLKRVGRIEKHQLVGIVAQVAKALTRAHTAGLVHRDLKPANIFLVPDEDRDLAKVLDFGVAKSSIHDLGDSNTKTGAMMGTPYYMSPEQTRGTRAVDHRADLWALAVIVYQCLTGQLPFNSEALGDLLFKIAIEPLPVPSHVAQDLPPGFDGWWERAAMRDPAQRFQTARELVDALGVALGVATGFAASGGGPGAWGGGAVAGDGSMANARPPSGAGGMATPQPSWSANGGAGPGPGFVPSPSTVAISAQSMAEAPVTRSAVTGSAPPDAPSAAAPAPGGRTATVIAAVAGALVVGGLLAYVLLGRAGQPAHRGAAVAAAAPGPPDHVAPPATAAPSVAPEPPVKSAPPVAAEPSVAVAPPPEPTTAPIASAAAAPPVAVPPATAPGKPGGAKGGRSPGGARPPPGPKAVPDYGI